jgi:hypothetical protein
MADFLAVFFITLGTAGVFLVVWAVSVLRDGRRLRGRLM